MAEKLPFSVANILRSDFPHPSRISKIPSIVHVTPSRERRKAFFFTMRCRPVQRLPQCCYETRATGGKSLHTVCTVEKDASENLGDVQGQKRNLLTGGMKEENNSNKRTVEEPRGSKTTGEEITKQKRNRSRFSKFQLEHLEDIFSRQHYLTRDERALLASALEMKELQIRNWFQNRRYLSRQRRVNRSTQAPAEVLVSSRTPHASEGR